MPEYIEREALVYDFEHCGAESATINAIVYRINLHKAADVAPVVHGRWIWNEECHCWVCSNCYLSALNNYRGWSTESNYCPNCGARMDGE